MPKPTVSAVAVLILTLVAPVAGADSVEIRHDAVACVAVDRYAGISATAVPPAGVASAELQFRETPAGGWYSVRMAAEGDRWTAVLPKPLSSLGRFEYRIVMTGPDLKVTETEAFAVEVAADARTCAQGRYSAEVSSPIVISVPAGAPVMPPVPGGFSPAGVVAARGPKERGPWKTKWLTVAGIAGALAGAAAARTDSGLEPDRNVITIEILRTEQTTGRLVRLSRLDPILRMRVSDGPRSPLTLVWRLAGHSPEHGAICVTTGGVVSLGAAPRPITVDLVPAPFEVAPACGERFGIDTGHMTVTRDGQLLFDGTLTLQYRFEP